MAHGEAQVPTPESAVRRAAVKVVAAWIVLPLFLLVTGGSFAWWEAWVYCAATLVPMTLFVAHMIRRDPGFLSRRSMKREKERTQRRIMAWSYPPALALFIMPGLDRRFGWSEPPVAVEVAALAMVLAGYLVILRVFLENRWAGRTVEVFPGHEVISTGPYSMVRHPMYVGSATLYLATPVALGSWWALIPALAFVPIFVLRIRHEEEVLVRDLPGYDQYRQRVRYRLVPFVW